MVGFIGWAFNKALGWAMPGLSASVLYLLAGLLSIGIPSAYAWHKGSEGKAAAIATERAACAIDKARDEAATSRALSSLMDEISKLSTTDDDGKTAAQLCAGSPFCRDGGKKK